MKDEGRTTEEEARVDEAGLLAALLDLAQSEGALEGPALRAFQDALGERARIILEARVGDAEREIAWRRGSMAGLESETAWRRESMESLEAELAWRREVTTSLQAENDRKERDLALLQDEVARWRESVAALEKESSWLREGTAGLEHENAWRREAMTELQAENTWRREAMAGLEGENARLRQAMAELEAGLRQALGEAQQAHASLLRHHRHLVQQVLDEVVAVAAMPAWRTRSARARLLALATLIRPEAT